MTRYRKIIFALIPAVVLFGLLEVACLVWERFDPPATELVQAPNAFQAKGPNEFRVLFYGGSTVAGEPEPAVAFVAQLKSYLHKLVPGKEIGFANLGKGGMPSAYTVRAMYQSVHESEADAIVVLAAHNEFLLINDMTEEELTYLYAIQETMHRSALMRRARRMHYRYVTARRADLLRGDNLSRFDRNSARHAERAAFFESNMGSIVRIAERSGIPLFLCTGPCNVADWAPADDKYSKYATAEGYRESVKRARHLLAQGKAAEALQFCEAALRKVPGDANLTYQMGRAHYELGEYDQARELLYRARDFDTIPFRVLSRFNETIRGKHEPPQVYVVDLARLFDANSPNGITGFDLVADNCHPTPVGGFLIATALIDSFAEAGLLELNHSAASMVSLGAFLEEAQFERRKASYFLTNARTAMKPPYLNWDLAERYLRNALEADPDHWEVLANLATVFFMKSDTREAQRFLELAVEKKGSGIDPDDREATPYLKDAMEKAGYALPE